MAKCYLESNDFKQALECATKAFDFIERNITHVHDENTILLAKSDYKTAALELSEVYRRRYDYANQRKYAELSKKYDGEIQNSFIEADIKTMALNLKTEADSIASGGNFKLALDKYRQAEKIFESLYLEEKDAECFYLECLCKFEQAKVYTMHSNFEQSGKLSEEIIDALVSDKHENNYNFIRLTSAAYEQLVYSGIKLKKYNELPEQLSRYLNYAQQAADMFNDLDTRKDLARCRVHIAEYSFDIGMIDNAINNQRLARNIYSVHYDESEKYKGIEKFIALDLAECCTSLSKYYYAAGDKAKSAEYYEECYAVLRKYIDGKDGYLHDIAEEAFFRAAEIEEEMNNDDKAIIHYDRAFDNFFKAYEAYGTVISLRSAVLALMKLAAVEVKNGRYDSAVKCYDAAITAAHKEKDDMYLNNYKALSFWNSGNIMDGEQALMYKQTAVNIWQNLVLEYPDVEIFRENLSGALKNI